MVFPKCQIGSEFLPLSGISLSLWHNPLLLCMLREEFSAVNFGAQYQLSGALSGLECLGCKCGCSCTPFLREEEAIEDREFSPDNSSQV